MRKKLRIAIFKMIDLMVIFTMVFASPMSITASAMAQDAGPTLVTDKSDYETGGSARITGSGFAAGEYVLAASHDGDVSDWDSVTIDETGVFVIDSPALDADGAYEVRAYTSPWSGNWDDTSIASASFTVTAPPPPTEIPTEEPTATEPPTAEPTATLIEEPTTPEPPVEETTNTPTEEPTAEPTNTLTDEPTATEPPTAEPTNTAQPTEEPTQEPTNTPTEELTATPSGSPTIMSDKEDYFPGELVTLTGTNWQGDTEVRVIVNDDVGQTWKRDVSVVVADDGTIYDSFNLPAWFVATYYVTASGQQTGRVITYSFTDSAGSYSLDFSAADPGDSPTYPKVTPAQLACPTPSGGTGRAADPLANAIFGNPNDSVESLAPEDMILGQIVPFETEIRVTGPVTPENGRIKIVQTFLAKTTNGGNFGFDPTYGVYCAFIDTADSGNATLAASTKVESFSYTILQAGTSNERIEATIIISGLVNPERAVLETWVVLKNTIPAGTTGNVQTSIGPAQTCTNANCTTGENISTGNQTVPLLRSQEFFTTDADLSVTKSDSPDPVVQGDQLTYTINVTNNGPATANGITVTDTLDANTSYVSSSVPCSGTTTLTCSVGNLDVGASTSFTITVLVSGSAPTTITPGTNAITGTCTAGSQDLCNLVSVDAINDDPTVGNNTDSEPTNVLARGGITINKVALGGDATFGYTTTGSGLSAFNITTTNGSGSQSFTNIAPGAKTVTESAPPAGWDFTSLSCSDPDNGTTTSGQTANIDLDPGESITCTYTNTKRGTIIVEKQTDPGGAADDFTFTGDAAGTISDGEQITVSDLAPGTYTSTETDPSPTWALTSIACDDGASTTPSTFDLGTRTATFHLDPGETVKCTFTNSLQQGTLTVIKTVVNDNGGTATSNQWSIHVTSSGTDVAGSPQAGSATGTNYSLTQGTYNVSETGGPSGYAFTGFSGDCDNSGNVTIVAGQTKTCTLTNNDQPGTLIVKKVVVNNNGGTLEADDFTFQVNGGSAISFEADGQNDLTVNTGTYTVTEPAVSGYSTTYDNCTDVVVPNGGSATCTITNDDQASTLIVKKVVINNNGGTLEADDFTFQVNGGSAISFEADGQNDLSVSAGTYTVTEPAISGYTTTYDNCSNLVIPNGGTATCTITNDDQPGTLIVKKVVINDNGGTLEADDFTFSVNGGAATPFEGDGQNDLTVNAGTYTVTEPAVSGYSTAYDNCSNLVIPNGGSATCTITNNDQAATLIVRKVVVNNNGGTLDVEDFSFQVNGGAAVPFEADGQNNLSVNAGTYTVTEPAVSGYTTTYDNCSNLVIPNGGSATCTITNDDQAATLIIIKHVVNDNGGTAQAGDFSMTVNGTNVQPSASFPGAEAPGTTVTLNAGSYSVSETNVTGYTSDGGSAGCSGAIANGETKTCTFTNNDNAPSLTLVKVVVNDNGGTALASAFTLSADGPTPISGAGGTTSDAAFQAGTYDLSETSVAGYTAGTWSCVGGTQNSAQITLELGESAICTITNNDNAPSLTLVKVLIHDNGGTATEASFTLSADGPTPISGAGGATSDAAFEVGTYDLSETGPAGYSASDWVCVGGTQGDEDTITLGLGESATCTITNDDQAPSLTLVKVVTNSDGGDAAESDWTLTATGPTGFSGPGPSVSNNASFDAGTYDLSESGPGGYTASDWVCIGGTQDDEDTITLELGESATCTIANDDIAPTLKLVKVVSNDDGGNAVANDWMLHAVAAAPNDGRNFSNMGGSGDFETIYANTPYNLSESVIAGYTAGAWSCNGGTLVDSTVTLAQGETNITCTITNDDSAPTLTLIKIVVNDDGGDAVVADFPLFIGGNPTASGQSNTLKANTLYTASETTQPGYTASVWGGDCAADGTITLSEGQNATCTITNDDVAPTLKLVKNVLNDNGGNAASDDWTLSAAAAAPFEGRNFSDAGGSGDFEPIFANHGYDLSETSLPGYTAGSWTCNGGTLNGSTITLAEGENVTCTITNNDIAPQLRIVKTVVNDDGGDAVVADFPLFIDGSSVTSGVFVEVTANEVHTASETNQTGYTASVWGGDCAADGKVTLNEGDVKTCTITNDDIAPTLKLVKVVVNDNGGNAVEDDWTLSASAAAPDDERNFSNLGGSGVFETVFANVGYDLSETTVPGYTAGAWSCEGGALVGSTVTLTEGETGVTCTIINNDSAPTLTLIKNVVGDNGGNAEPDDFHLTIGGNPATSGTTYTLDANKPYAINETQLSGYTFVDITGDLECPTVLGGTVTLDEGENVTCTITNDDVAPTLTLIKNVINDHGGTAEPNDFNLTIGGSPATSGTAYLLSANTAYEINETLVSGYSFVSISGDPECPEVLAGTVTLDEGENITCIITNDDQPATLVVIKHVINDNGGTAEASDFTLDSGGTDDTPDNFPGEEAPGTTITLDAGAYIVSESGPSGYSSSFSADCSGTITNGETKTCTVINDDQAATLIVIKHVINDNGGTAVASAFTLDSGGINDSPDNFAGAEAPGTTVTLDAGSYNVTETGPSGYSASFSADCSGTITNGQTKTCTVTNDDISPTLTVVKVLLPGDDVGLFNLQIDGISHATNVGDNGTTGPVAVDAGVVHTVGETAGTDTSLSDYVTSIGGDCAADGTVSLSLAENKTCTIMNIRRGSIIIVKNTLGGDGTFDFTSNTLGNFSLSTSSGTTSTTFSGLDPANTYDVAETVPPGWELNAAMCNNGENIDSIDLDPGETVTCTFENEKAGSIIIVKNTVGGNGTFNFTSSTLGNFSLMTSSNTASTTFSNLDVDITYDVAETVPAGWDLTSATCNSGETINSIDLNPGETVTCTFTNTQRGHIIVDKVTNPSGDSQGFSFDASGGTSPAYADFNLTDAAAPNDQTLKPGSYSVVEGALAGWDLTGLTCNDANGSVSPGTRTANIMLDPGETVTCTFTNTKRGTIKIIKDAVPNDAQDFTFTRSFGANFMLDDDSNTVLQNNVTFLNLVPGAYSVTESAVAGWDLTSLTCNDANGTTNPGTRTANIALDPGENAICTFTNTKRGTIIVEKQTNPNGAPGNFTFTGTVAGTIADNGTITVANLVPGTYTSTEANPSVTLFALTSIVCNDGGSANPSTGNLATRTATFKLDPGETVRCVFTNTKDFHAGTIGFWKNWRNHYTSSQFQLLINYLKTNNALVYNKPGYPLTVAVVDAIYNLGSGTPREQMILAQFTALKFNMAITQLDGTGGLVQKNDDLCTAGVVNVSGISGAATFFGTSTPTVGQVVNAVESKWTGKLTTNRNDWKWNFTNAQKDMLINVITGMNEGTLIMSSGCP
ncbi:MAG TPA: hypothetical protein VFG81_05165 [Anaerolineales bacterium]|nr:hypothetical protein [Anaerolineales bacterium]